jgi:hypothetical protein
MVLVQMVGTLKMRVDHRVIEYVYCCGKTAKRNNKNNNITPQ